ncbi:MAG: hypothetical protein ABR571_01970 [Jatrophihabitans sp.]|uniref:hypothetical protein n=1 Tax=Jatrophihabitans sp. TaxID=1932789 RepID=UPI0039127C84
MLTQAAARAVRTADQIGPGVYTRAELIARGCTRSQITARVAANRWRAIGRAVVLGNGELTHAETWEVAVLNCGPRAVLASFSAAERRGLVGWERDPAYVLAPAGTRLPQLPIPLVLYRARRLDPAALHRNLRCQRIEPAVTLAARDLPNARTACGLVAAVVQQRLTTVPLLRCAVDAAPTARHHRALLLALDDIEMGAHALSEIDFVRLCRRNGLPGPALQQVRRERSGRRRYLDAEWTLPGGRRVVVEVDGAVHLAPRRWFDDQLRQNELSLAGALVLRYPSVVVRTEEPLVADQLRRALGSV